MSERQRDQYDRAIYSDTEVPPATERFAQWRGRTTHPDAVVTGHHGACIGGWVASGGWWLHCGTCRPRPEPEEWGDGCKCWVTPESTWFRYGSAVEPGSQVEYNPECSKHNTSSAAGR